MPFFGNTASSPNQYATLSSSKEVSTTNLTSDYNSQYYGDTTTAADSNNQYYGQSYDNQNYNQGYNQNYDQGYNQNYDQGYNQDYNSQYPANQYPAGNYENEIAAPQGAPPSSYDAAVPPPVPTTTYESRRESMNPNSHPTVSNITGAYICAYKYDPQLDDELALQVNDQVQIIEEYEDGWMKAVNLTTGKEGMAPRVCIKEA
ncbi:hypothetical protein BCR32DRAFT_80359 [Anaeromyces robustus]|uniref:SH3 domain-containing protein n=1 Tax=Anaeromyces robustus TaxID=1754192 RepID=A0A1Y1XJ44_9FUNG|nr:hypothetical protein BCR32DRAFT_80359 [Anaeromyces robustus]|eukprot:ORX85775.1 hypothetical protein BCR32DRAFT_80359 [Anaeromyces robustus]